ncbi:MAG: hypothetical protein HQK49_12135 [Oligoflexia bacterium]|nr:hypothetical protein [Oligoflexia bacterium]
MKVNLMLFALLSIILLLIYYFEEKRGVEKLREERIKFAFLDPRITLQNIDAISMKNFFLKSGSCEKGIETKKGPLTINDKCFFIKEGGGYAADSAHIQNMLETLSKLKIERYLSEEEIKGLKRTDIFTDEAIIFYFDYLGLRTTYTLGKRLSFDETFYVEIKKSAAAATAAAASVVWAIVKDEAPKSGLYTNEEDIKQESYQNIKTILLKRASDFFDKKIFSKHYLHDQIADFNIQNMEISNKINRTFYIKWNASNEVVTSPEIIKGLKYKTDELLEIKKRLLDLAGEDIYFKDIDVGVDVGGDLVSTIKLDLLKGNKFRRVEMKLYKEMKIKSVKAVSRKGYFLQTNISNNIFELSESDAKIFFLNVQDFWDKRVINFVQLNGGLYSNTISENKVQMIDFEIKFDSGEIIALYHLPNNLNNLNNLNNPNNQNNNPKFNFKKLIKGKQNIRYVPKQKAWEWLWNFLSGNGEYKEAQRVSLLSDTFKQIANDSPGIELKINQLILRINIVADEIIVSNLTEGYRLHYLMPKRFNFNLNFNLATFFYLLTEKN